MNNHQILSMVRPPYGTATSRLSWSRAKVVKSNITVRRSNAPVSSPRDQRLTLTRWKNTLSGSVPCGWDHTASKSSPSDAIPW